jgi:hypothetical protein
LMMPPSITNPIIHQRRPGTVNEVIVIRIRCGTEQYHDEGAEAHDPSVVSVYSEALSL